MTDRRLIRHLCTALTVKLVLLAGLWWCFVRDRPVDADTDRTAAHVAGVQNTAGRKP